MAVLITTAVNAIFPEIDLLPNIAWHKNANNGNNITRMLATMGDMGSKLFTLIFQFVDVFRINGFEMSIYLEDNG